MAGEWEVVSEKNTTPDNNGWVDVSSIEKGVDTDVVNNLPETLQVGFWNTQIPVSEEVSAGLVGAGDMMLDTYHGVKQMLGMDEESMKQEQDAMNRLYESDVGGYAMTGAVVGALAEPIGALIPMGKSKTIGKAIAKGATIGAGFGGAGYVDEEAGQTRLKNTAMGATIGGILTGAVKTGSKVLGKRRITKAHNNINEIEKRWADKVVDGIPVKEIRNQLLEEIPNELKSLKASTAVTGRKPKLSMGVDEAHEVSKYYSNFTKQNNVSLGFDKALGIVSTRIKNISKPIFGSVRKYDRNVMQRTHDLLTDSHPFLDGYNKIGGNEKKIIDKALLNGDIDIVESILRKNGGEPLVKSYQKVASMLNNLGDELQQSGRITGKIENYFPRYVKDKDGLFNAIGKIEKTRIEKALEDAYAKHGKLTKLQESEIINKHMRGQQLKASRAGFSKRRGIERLDDRLMEFYSTPEESLHSYLRNAVTDLEKTRFFGKDVQYKDVGGNKVFDIDNSVGEVVRKQLDNKSITHAQVGELTELLNVRFGIGERAPSESIQLTKNIIYSSLLGNPLSAATQLGDLGVAMYMNGFKNTLKALPKALIGKSEISATDFGLIDNMAEEFATTTKSARMLRNFFKWSGFKSIDKLGKETLLNGALIKFRKLSKTPNGRGIMGEKYRKVFGNEYDSLVDDLQKGKVSENVKMLLFNELADVQPISLSEVPQKYLEHPNGRIVYMLKTFMLKQMDVIRREAYQEIKKGNKAKGLKNLMKYGIVVGSTNTGSQYVKDLMLGKDIEPDLPEDIGLNLFKTFGYSEYLLNKVKDGNPVEATYDVVLPPFKMFDKILQMDEKSTQYMPLAGKLWYYWFGGGLEDFEERKAQQKYRKQTEE